MLTVLVCVILLPVAIMGWIYGSAVINGDYTKAGVVRLHVLANSDTIEDQALKRKVRDAVIDYMKPYMLASANKFEAEQVLSEHLPVVQEITRQVVQANGFDYPVRVELGQHLFPTKTYGDLALPAGNYQALRVLIGNAEGQNWWCVLFPPLCFVDATNSLAISAQTQQINDEISRQQMPEIRFKLWEWWHEKQEGTVGRKWVTGDQWN
jgi:stage II sporulation protein R